MFGFTFGGYCEWDFAFSEFIIKGTAFCVFILQPEIFWILTSSSSLLVECSHFFLYITMLLENIDNLTSCFPILRCFISFCTLIVFAKSSNTSLKILVLFKIWGQIFSGFFFTSCDDGYWFVICNIYNVDIFSFYI